MLFKDKYAFLSNFYNCPVPLFIDGIMYVFANSESAYQVQKNLDYAKDFLNLTGKEAKLRGKQIPITTPNWETYGRYDAMRICLLSKFTHNPNLMECLRDVKEPIEETNYWNDTIWGVCNGVGENVLGRMLMELRDTGNIELSNYVKD